MPNTNFLDNLNASSLVPVPNSIGHSQSPQRLAVQKIHRRFAAILSTTVACIGAHSIGTLHTYNDHRISAWRREALMLLPTTTISMRFSLHLKRLQDWPIPANVTIEPNESWLAQGQEPTIAEWAEEKAKIDAAPTNSAERFCRELNRKLRRLNLWISDDCWDWKAPVVLYQRDVQLVTLSFESNFLLGHLKAVGEWQQWVADAIATPPAELLEYRQGITDWEQQWTSRGAFVSWWWQKQQRAKAEGKEQWGGVECPVMSICRLCREEVRRVEICEHCDTAWFLCEKCG